MTSDKSIRISGDIHHKFKIYCTKNKFEIKSKMEEMINQFLKKEAGKFN